MNAAMRPPERHIYEQMWARDEYRIVAPGEQVAQLFIEQARPKPGSMVIDFGAGTGRGALMLAILGGLRVTMIDFAENCLDADIRKGLETQSEVLKFVQADLTRPVPISAPYGFCTDVMEHIPPDDVDTVLRNVLGAAEHVFFQISCTDDSCGVLIGHPLHLSVHPFEWWLKKLQALDASIHWSRDCGTHCMFYCSAWITAKYIADHSELNEELQNIRRNVTANSAPKYQQLRPHDLNPTPEVMILAGGPSLNDFQITIKQLRAAGVKLVTLNGSYQWALDHGLVPSAQCVVDARPFNARFTKPYVPGCKYLLASQCDPGVYEGIPREAIWQWHTGVSDIRDILDAHLSEYYEIPGGQTVLLRSIALLRVLGYRQMHLFGADSCLVDGAHHAYKQNENNTDQVIAVTCGGRVFYCQPWMVAQAQGFVETIQMLGDLIELEVYGDGLLRHILQTGAELETAEDFLV
jgi:hypothetical protein